MKKAIILAAMLALPTFAGQKVIIQQAPVQPVAPAPAVSPWAVELGASYTWGVPDIFLDNNGHCKEIKSIGADITGVYNINENHAVTLRFGYSWGGEKFASGGDGEYSWDWRSAPSSWDWRSAPSTSPSSGYFGGYKYSWDKVRIHTFSLMPGYRYTAPITDKLSWFVGANIGIANASYKMSWYEGSERYGADHKSAWGFAYSAEAGLRYNFCSSVYGFVAYQYCGNTASPKIEGERFAHRQHGHQARVGVGFNF